MADGTLTRIETDPDAPYPLGRSIVWHDPQNRLHRALPLEAEQLPDRTRQWFSPDQFDQVGSSCTMQSATKVARTGPCRKLFLPHWPKLDTEEERHAAYLASQLCCDPYPGGEPDYEGSSTDAPYKWMREQGMITGWKWLFGFHEVKQWVMHHNACSVGTTWFNSMFTVGTDGFIRIDASKGIGGGHAYALVGWSKSRHAFRVHNSWGRGWGQNGRAWLHEDDLGTLLADQGEAATIVL